MTSSPVESPDSDSAAPGEQPSFAVRCIRALMERHGLPKYRQSAWLADATGLSYSQAHRRMSGTSTWSLEDIAKVAELFGESLADVVSLASPRTSVPGTMRLGTTTLPVQLWLGDALDKPSPEAVVAVQTSSGWSALVAGEATEGVAYRIERLEARPPLAPRRVVAVLDDDRDLTNSICAHFESSGYDARPFFTIAELLASPQTRRYDAYVVDWIVGETSALKLIATLRARDATCPIVVLTAQVMSGVVDEADIADAVKRYDLVFHEKPVRTSILVATLGRAFSGP
ncbi:MAG: helix-turn-helix domain-containing protein [Caldimonas sp.]